MAKVLLLGQPGNNGFFIQGRKVGSDGWTGRLAPGHGVKATSKSILSARPRPWGSILCEVPRVTENHRGVVPGSPEPRLGSGAVATAGMWQPSTDERYGALQACRDPTHWEGGVAARKGLGEEGAC